MRYIPKKKQIPKEDLTDIPSKLWRGITDSIVVTEASWKTYLDDYIRNLHPDRPDKMEAIKRERSWTVGNINEALWQRPTLTFKKLLTGLFILKAVSMKVTIEVELKSGKKVIVTEENNFLESSAAKMDEESTEKTTKRRSR